jgi:hypothetical protein
MTKNLNFKFIRVLVRCSYEVDSIGYDWITITASSGILASILSVIVNEHIRSKDEKEKIKKNLYYPLFIGCRSIIEIIDKYENLGENRSRELFVSTSKIFDKIIFDRSIIYLKESELKQFLFMKNIIDRNYQIFETRSWEFVKKSLKSNEFTKARQYSSDLISICVREEKNLRAIEEII